MKSINIDEIIKPEQLTSDFYSCLMSTEGKRKGIFQILQIKKKRDKVYSTQANDGYFRLKIMMVNQAALQIQQEIIKQHYILQGWLRNHGDGVVVAKQQFKIWQHHTIVGDPIPWKLKKPNINSKGSSKIAIKLEHKEPEETISNPPVQEIQTKISSLLDHEQSKKQSIQVIQVEEDKQQVDSVKIETRSTNNLNLKFIYDLIQQQQTVVCHQSQIKGSKLNKNIKQGSKYDFLFQQDLEQTITKPIIKKQKISYSQFFSQQKQIPPPQIAYKSITKSIQIEQSNVQIPLSDLYYGYFKNNIPRWQVKCILICVMSESDNQIEIIVGDQFGQYLVIARFTNSHICRDLLIQGEQVLLNNCLSKYSQKGLFPCTLQFDCSKNNIQLIKTQSKHLQKIQNNFIQLRNIYELAQNQKINTYGVLKSFKIIQKKANPFITYLIIDPLTKHQIDLIDFGPDLSQNLQEHVGHIVTIFGVVTSSYKLKTNIICKPTSFLKFSWVLPSLRAQSMKQWCNQNNHQNIDVQLIGFTKSDSLKEASIHQYNMKIVQRVRVLEINQNYSYLACSNCFKKVQNGKCRSCGIRNKDQIIDKIFLRGIIGDSTCHTRVIWSESSIAGMVQQGFSKWTEKYLLNYVNVWLEKGSSSAVIVKMTIQQPKNTICELFKFIKQHSL